jgi:hypothetical protein
VSEDPQLFVKGCDCGDPHCKKILIAIIRPDMKTLENTEELVPCCHLPEEHIQSLVDYIRELCKEKGIRIR